MDRNSKSMDNAYYGHPKPLKGLFFTEFWERFSYYGILPLLILYMSAIVAEGGLGLDSASSAALVGVFAGSIYLASVFGGWIADNYLGQIKSVYIGSIIIALGHLSIALNAIFDNFFFYFGLVLIVLGSGLFKTCISVIVGSLYDDNDQRRDAGFSIFYMGINLGGFVAPLITGLLIAHQGWHIGFGIGGLGMLLALLIFRFHTIPQLKQFHEWQKIHKPELALTTFDQPANQHPHAAKIVYGFLAVLTAVIVLTYFDIIQINLTLFATYLTLIVCLCIVLYFIYLMFFSTFNKREKTNLLLCFILLVSSALYWSAFEQSPTTMNIFARDYTDRMLFGFEIPTVWFQSINSIFIVIFAPIAAWVWIKLGRANKEPGHISKFIIALLFAAASFAVMGIASQAIITGNGGLASPLWLVGSFLLMTLGELCLSPIGLSAMTKFSPTKIRGQMMGLWFAAIALGNLMAGLVGGEILSSNIEQFPELFYKCVIALVIGAAILLIIKPFISRLLNKAIDDESGNNNHKESL